MWELVKGRSGESVVNIGIGGFAPHTSTRAPANLCVDYALQVTGYLSARRSTRPKRVHSVPNEEYMEEIILFGISSMRDNCVFICIILYSAMSSIT